MARQALENQIMTVATADTLIPPFPANSPNDPSVSDLVGRARNGDKQAWDALVERYAPLIWSICRRHRLGRADADDVGQSVWLRLVDQLDRSASRPRCPAGSPPPPGGNASASCARATYRTRPGMRWTSTASRTSGPDRAEQELLAAERHAALREAFTQLPPNGQQLITLLIADPPVPYADISAQLGIPVGSIGPTRSRYLAKMRRHPAIAALLKCLTGLNARGRSAFRRAEPQRQVCGLQGLVHGRGKVGPHRVEVGGVL